MLTIQKTYTFNYTGNVQTLNLPSYTTSILIEAYGAQGGGTGGKGGKAYGTYIFKDTDSRTLNIYIGGQNGYNGGGAPAGAVARIGGGATDIRINGTALTNRIIVAGGGGSGYNKTGGAGGGLIGMDGLNAGDAYSSEIAGKGGTQTAGGAGGTATGSGIVQGGAGSLGKGGTGGTNTAGGGGGYYGGGSGANGANYQFSSAGGGSSYIDLLDSTTQLTEAGVNAGNGYCVITAFESLEPITNITLNKTSDSITIGSTDILTTSISPSNATIQTINWSSSDTTIATVNSSGLVTAKSQGTCTITASSTDGSNVIATCQITVIGKPIFSGNVSLTSTHNSDIQLSGSITNNATVQYKISVNGNQIYPESGYTDLLNSPANINYTISNNLLNLLTNAVTIDYMNSYGLTGTNSYNVSIYNNTPTGILTSSNTTIHGEDITITGSLSDPDLDQISYRILLNHNEILPWIGFLDSPQINYTIINSLLNIGDNIVNIEYKDNFKNSITNIWSQVITKNNNTAIINIQYINGSVIGNITDPDSDLTQYKILINGNQRYPDNDFTEFNNNSTINYQINRSDILIGKDNIVTIVAKDSLGSEITQEISFIGDYVGLMFMDENKQFYTTDIGELLKYLDFGIITLGQITEPIKILVQNKYGFNIKDINLYIQNTLSNVNIEFSKEENPFIPTNNLLLEKEYMINEIDYFYIRLNTSISQNSVNGEFKIIAKAVPID